MIALFLLLLLAAVILGLVGFVVEGLLYLLALGVVVFLVAFVLLGVALRGRGRRRVQR